MTMKMYIKTDEAGYLTEVYEGDGAAEGAFEIERPEGFDVGRLTAYRYANGVTSLDQARADAITAAAARHVALAKRQQLLTDTDYLMMPDYPLPDDKRAAVTAYRQALRDITKQPGYPNNIIWPVSPV